MLTVFGSVALDTIRTPKRTLVDTLGGAAVYAAVSASYFVKTGLVAVAGSDLPEKDYQTLARYATLDGLITKPGKTFRYDGSYDETLSVRTTLKTELNVLEGFRPAVPDTYAASRYIYLANNDPDQNLEFLRKFGRKPKFSVCDTIHFWIETKRQSVIRMMSAVDAAVINDEEARLLARGEDNLATCAKKIQKETKVPYLIIKKGQHGSLLFYKNKVVAAPAYTLEDAVDPTGAGDAFAGALIGYMAAVDSSSILIHDLKRAITYGSVMGAFAVEDYGLKGLLDITRSQHIERRAHRYTRGLPV